MFSSPAPSKSRHAALRQHAQANSPYREARKSIVSPSPSVDSASAMQEDPVPLAPRREYASDFRAGVFSRRPEYTVSSLSALPQELQQTLHTTDSENAPCRGTVDSLTGFALVSLAEETFVWNYSPSAATTSACYIFPNPSSASSSRSKPSLPLGAMVPYQSSQEPGLILCSPEGDLRFWVNVSLGLTGGESHNSVKVGLSSGERVLKLLRAEPTLFLIFSSYGRLFRATISSSGGRRHCGVALITDSKNLLSRVASSLFTSVAPLENSENAAVAIARHAEQEGLSVWTLTDRRIQRWLLSADSWDELLLEHNISSILATRLARDVLNNTVTPSQLQLKLHDIASSSSQMIIILISYVDPASGEPRRERIFGLARLTFDQNVLQIASFDLLPYQSRDATTSLALGLKMIGKESDVAFVHARDSLVVQSLARDDAFQSTLRLKNPWNQILAVEPGHGGESGSLVVLTLDNGILDWQVDLQKIQHSSSETPTNRLRATMEQQVFFGMNAENPFLFQLEPQLHGSVGLAAEQLSGDIVASRSEFLAGSSDMRVHLAERQSRLLSLIKFIASAKALSTLSEISKQRLWLDSNKLYVGEKLWELYNRSSSEGAPHGRDTVLRQAINDWIRRLGVVGAEDPVRSFFRTQLHNVEVLFDEFYHILERVPQDNRNARFTTLMQCSDVLLNMWTSSLSHRLANLDRYGIGEKIFVPTWGFTHIHSAQYFLEETVRALESTSSSDRHAVWPTQADLEQRLQDLASLTLTMWDTYRDYLASNRDQSAAQAAEFQTFSDKLASTRLQILGALVKWGGSQLAYQLADEYHEYGFLVKLCTDPLHGGRTKTIEYLTKYREAFAFHLYKWYLENGQLHELLEPRPEFLPLVEAFFSTNHYPRVEWIHDLSMPVSNFDSSAIALHTASQTETKLEAKHVMLSLTKLGAMASLETPEDGPGHKIQDVNTELDRISVHESLLNDFHAAVGETTTASVDLLSDAIASDCIAATLTLSPSFTMVYKQLVKRLLIGNALPIDDLVELLSMKDTGNRSNDLATALMVLPTHSKSSYVVGTIWRRCYLADDWTAFNDSLSDDARDALLHTTYLSGCLSILEASSVSVGDIYLSPQECLTIPSIPELSSRHPGFTGAQVAELRIAYEKEATNLQILIANYGIQEWVDRLLA